MQLGFPLLGPDLDPDPNSNPRTDGNVSSLPSFPPLGYFRMGGKDIDSRMNGLGAAVELVGCKLAGLLYSTYLKRLLLLLLLASCLFF